MMAAARLMKSGRFSCYQVYELTYHSRRGVHFCQIGFLRIIIVR
jgi:hypothetical protein